MTACLTLLLLNCPRDCASFVAKKTFSKKDTALAKVIFVIVLLGSATLKILSKLLRFFCGFSIF